MTKKPKKNHHKVDPNDPNAIEYLKHTVSTDALDTLGMIIDETAGRDAIHLAVEPILAGQALFPGQNVGIKDGHALIHGVEHVGIVDPFLKDMVEPEQRFWLVLYPRTITSLRHVWTHPAFDVEPEVKDPIVAMSEQWIRDFVAGADCPDYETLMQALKTGSVNDEDVSFSWYNEYLHFNGIDAHSSIPPEFWDHVSIVLGHEVPAHKRAEYFSCSC